MATQTTMPEPDFRDSKELREYCNHVRKACHLTAMALHIGASEIQAALETIPPAKGGVISRWQQKRRARRVARHMTYAAMCAVSAGAGAVRTWGAFRTEYAPELAPVRGRRSAFQVVPE